MSNMISVEPSVRAKILERRTYLRPVDGQEDKFETVEQHYDRMVDHQRWLWERAKGGMVREEVDGVMQFKLVPLSQDEENELQELRSILINRKTRLAGRTHWMGGTDVVKKREISNFNCSAKNLLRAADFVDEFWLLLNGSGTGFRPVPRAGHLKGFLHPIPDVEVIPSTREDKNGNTRNVETLNDGVWAIQIGDSAEAWARSIGKILAKKIKCHKLILDFSQIRPAGERLKGYGWICCGYQPLADAYVRIVGILNEAHGRLLTELECIDIMNLLGTVLSTRRAAEIAIVDYQNPMSADFAVMKRNFWSPEVNKPWRGQSNNSLGFWAKPSHQELTNVFQLLVESGGSEPGLYNFEAANARAPYHVDLTNPCLTDDAFIMTKDGLRQIKDLRDDEFVAVCKDNESPARPFFPTGFKNVFILKTGSGHFLRGTADHPVLTQNGWIGLGHLVKGDRVILSYGNDVEFGPQDEFDEGESIGRLEVTMTDEMLKRSSSFLKGYISGLFTARGTAYTQSNASLRYVSSYNRLDLIQIALSTFGVHSNIVVGKGTTCLKLTGEGVLRFIDRITLPEGDLRDKVNIFLNDYQTNEPKLQREYAVVTEVVPDGQADVYDTTLSSMRGFSANGIIVHNCGEILLTGDGSLCNLTEPAWCHHNGDYVGLLRNVWLTARANYRQTCVWLEDGVLQPCWEDNQKSLRLCGVGMTGYMAWEFQGDRKKIREIREAAHDGANGMADELGSSRPALITTIKPSGTASKVMGTTKQEVPEGCHLPLAKYIFNNTGYHKDDTLVPKLRKANYKVDPHPFDPNAVLVCLPVAYENVQFTSVVLSNTPVEMTVFDYDTLNQTTASFEVLVGGKVVSTFDDVARNRVVVEYIPYTEVNLESALDQLERYRMLMEEYVDHNASITVYYDVEEVPGIVDWLHENWDSYVGVSFLFRTDPTKTAEDIGYPYLPQQPVTKKQYDDYVLQLGVVEFDEYDSAMLFDAYETEVCAAGGSCPVI